MFRNQRLDGTEFERFADDYGTVRPGYPPEPDVNGKVLRKANGKVREILESQMFFLIFLR